MAVYGYVRVSTKSQVLEGLSLDAQERQIKGYGMIHDLEIDSVFVEKAISGGKPIAKRPEGKRLLSLVESGDTVICSKLDRMFRSAKDALVVSEELQKMDVSLHLIDLGGDVTGNGVSKMFFTIVASFAEFERDRIAERISDVKSNEKEKGRFLGGSKPFGFQVADSGELIPDESEQKIINDVITLRGEGKSLRSISEAVSDNDTKVSHMTVKRIIANNLKQITNPSCLNEKPNISSAV